jgi:hypothetical protein
MTYLLDDLAKAGPVERRPDPSDRRARLVMLLPLEPDERVALRDMLQRLATRTCQTTDKPPTPAASSRSWPPALAEGVGAVARELYCR